jgi:hypothetical protein
LHRMLKTAARNPLVATLALTTLLGCSESTGTGETRSGAENKPVLMGNFAINTGTVVTNQDGTSMNIIDDYVLPAQLPNVNFEVFTIHLYAPVADDVSTAVDNVTIRVRRTDGTRTNDIFQEGHFVTRTTVNGQQYAVYQLNGFYNGTAITKANFANVTFDLRLSYEDEDGANLADRDVTLSVYQRQ